MITVNLTAWLFTLLFNTLFTDIIIFFVCSQQPYESDETESEGVPLRLEFDKWTDLRDYTLNAKELAKEIC